MIPPSLRRGLSRLDETMDGSSLAGAWQRLKWTLKYHLGRPGHVPDFETLLSRPHRAILLERLDGFGPWRSLLEVGCGRGVNLLLLAKRKPDATLAGIDTSVAAIRAARAELAKRGIWQVDLKAGTATKLVGCADKSVDVVLADAVLMYIPPEDIVVVLSEMLRVVRMGVVAGVWNMDMPPPGDPWRYDEGTWVYDYRRIIAESLGFNVNVEPYPVGAWDDVRWKRYGAILRIDADSVVEVEQP